MTSLPSHPPAKGFGQPLFSGYRLQPDGKASLFLPGFYNKEAKSEYQVTVKNRAGDVFNLVRKGDYWITKAKDRFSPGDAYQFMVEWLNPENQKKVQIPVLDHVETVVDKETGESFNQISSLEASAPSQVDIIAKLPLDRWDKSLTVLKLPQKSLEEGSEKLPTLFEVIEGLKTSGVSGIALSPFSESHSGEMSRFLVDDPYVLNPLLAKEGALKELLVSSIKDNTRFFASGIFTNQGIAGVQYQANIKHQYRSPFWNWFLFPESRRAKSKEGPYAYPDEAEKAKMALGFLPFQNTSDFEQFDYQIINDPTDEPEEIKGFKKPVYVEFYNPLIGKEGVEEEYEKQGKKLFDFKWRMEISPEELAAHRSELLEIEKEMGRPATPMERKAVFLEWKRFKIVTPYYDKSAEKWRTNPMVAKLNIKNPEVVDHITQGFLHWTHRAQNIYADHMARTLSEAAKNDKKVNWPLLIKQLGYEVPGYTEKELFSEFLKSEKTSVKPEETVSTLATAIIQDYPVFTLPFPTHFKQILTAPNFQKYLMEEPKSFWPQFFMQIFKPIISLFRKIPVVDRFFNGLEQSSLFTSVPFHIHLKDKLTEVMNGLSKEAKEKLNNPDFSGIMAEELSQFFYLHLLTGQEKIDAKNVEIGLYETLSDHVLVSDPVFGVRPLIDEMKSRLKDMPTEALVKMIEEKLASFDSQALSLACFLVDKKELGIHWQMNDFADVIDLDQIRAKETQDERNKAYLSAIESLAVPFWKEIKDRIHKVSPKAMLITNLNYDETLCDWATFQRVKEGLLKNNIFTSVSTPSNGVKNPASLFHGVPSFDSIGYQQSTPDKYLDDVLHPMSQTVSSALFKHHLNTLQTDLKSTLAHNLLFNPAIAHMDKAKNWGLPDYFREAVQEFKLKKCFKAQREELKMLGVEDVSTLLDNIIESLDSVDELKEGFSPHTLIYLGGENETGSLKGAIPLEIKKNFVDEFLNLFTLGSEEELDKNSQGIEDKGQEKKMLFILKKALLDRMAEPATDRAMRAVLVNQFEKLPLEQWDNLLGGLVSNLPKEKQPIYQEAVEKAFYQSLNKIIEEQRSRFGKKSIESVLAMVFDDPVFYKELIKELKEKSVEPFELSRFKPFLEKLKNSLFHQTMSEVEDKVLRMVALEAALPGNLLLDIPDLFAQTGSTWLRNRVGRTGEIKAFLKDRMPHPMARESFDKISKLLRFRKKYPALSQGHLFSPIIHKNDTVLPIIRDDGKNQAVMLINTGKPQNNLRQNLLGEAGIYSEIEAAQPTVKNYQLDLSSLRISPGTQYKDAETDERFVVQTNFKLVPMNKRKKGLAIQTYRLLIRVNESENG